MDPKGKQSFDDEKLEEMYENLTSLTKQLAMLQGFMESKYGSEYVRFCQEAEVSLSTENNSTTAGNSSLQDDGEEYDKMPNLVSQESPSRTLGYVTVPLRQSSGVPTPKLHPAPAATSAGPSRRDRSNSQKDGGLQAMTDNDEMMYQLHNFPDLLIENSGEIDANETPEFLEMELDPSALLRGEPPALHPMFADNVDEDLQRTSTGNSSTGKRNASRQSAYNRFDNETNSSRCNVSRRASTGAHENNLSQKKFDCLICGIKFEFAETLKSHMDSHIGSRNIRSNSEDQSGVGNNNANAPPLPKLMPRPVPSSVQIISSIDVKTEPIAIKTSRSKKAAVSSPIPASPTSSSSSTSTSSKSAALKRRKRYNQSRPCSLVCPECGLKIRDRSRLIEHLRGHTGERPFQCSFCDKSYTRKDVLKTHMLKMHGDEPAMYHAN